MENYEKKPFKIDVVRSVNVHLIQEEMSACNDE